MEITTMNEALVVMEKAKKYDDLILFPHNQMEVHCSFCHKTQSQVERLIAARHVHICNECVELCNEILEEERIVEKE